MTPRRKQSKTPGRSRVDVTPGKPSFPTTPGFRGWKPWTFRLLAVLGAPVLFFLLLEAGLRMTSFGYPTAFLLESLQDGQKTFTQNNQFGWRFFGRQMARVPSAFSFLQAKPPGTVRIFVLGESAAYGDPQPSFGLPRQLQAILSLRYPDVRFEIINGAMTGINSHTILPIARDCSRAAGDIWVIYAGNNEVVGPFGAGTIFGSRAPPLPFVRGGLALKTTRLGQCLDSFRQWLQKPPPEKSEWGGMLMFLDQQVRADSPLMETVYHHFERNLLDIVQIGQQSGAGVVLSTVAVNLKDCAPFASAHRPKLSESDRADWERLYQRGIEAQQVGKNHDAAEFFREAGRIDDTFAELRFRQAWCALALGQTQEAHGHFRAARDLDTLRFRCDSRLNELTRHIASGRERDRVLLADAEEAFAERSPDGVPGQDLFYEHVHLTFEGSYLLARTIAPQIEKLLPAGIAARAPAAQPWPSAADCAKRLAWTDWNRRAALADIFVRLHDPPFTGQLNHEGQMQQWAARLEKLAPMAQAAALGEARTLCEETAAAVPDDPFLQAQLAALRQLTGDLEGATSSARRVVELVPSSSEACAQLGIVLAQRKQFDDAAAGFRRAFQLDSQDVWSLENLAQVLAKLGRREEAIREYRRALAIKPRFGPAWLGLGQVLEPLGQKAEAEECYRKALANRVHLESELAKLAVFCQSRGWYEAATTNFEEASTLNPSDARMHLQAGQCLDALGRRSEAARHYAEAVRLEPESAPAHFLYGSDLGKVNKPAEAAEQFQQVLRLTPEMVEARLNLAIALSMQGSNSQAMAQFEEVLRRDPANTLALRASQTLRAKLAAAHKHP